MTLGVGGGDETGPGYPISGQTGLVPSSSEKRQQRQAFEDLEELPAEGQPAGRPGGHDRHALLAWPAVKGHGATGQQEGAGTTAEDAHDNAKPASIRRRWESSERFFHRGGHPDRRAGVTHPADEGVRHRDEHGRSAVAGGCRRRRLDGGRHTCYPPDEVISGSIISSRRHLRKGQNDRYVLLNRRPTPITAHYGRIDR